ncbi:PREDICTED: vinorine synthase-like [Nicotiana attenuata]|uniref:Bahd acyltransferase n=1 Tax=Nicotiana attenuata TaxID=49451 RepID=A0A1J6ING3_NICAT|nr:PREDICTED: vinorine synthase-like [Nicotiana attenuata]OIT06717.1 bahd acyltransferase [Nicotiana attenuata]
MEMKVEITHKDTIKPSSPTPLSQRNYKLSLIDQLTPGPYVPIVLFYDSTTKFSHDHLQKSLSKTLNYMYPLAGRIKDEFTIECNDKGVDFLEANVSNITLSNIVNDPKIGTLSQLLPCHPHARSKEPSDQILLAVQVTKFPCGGISIGVCVWHLIADASTLATLVNTWAKMNQENNVIGNGYIVDVTGIFPPRDLSNNPLLTMVPIPEELPFKISMKRFIFDNSKLAALIQSCERCPTRFEALSAFLWSAIISTWKDKKSEIKVCILMTSINLRKRMIPNLPTNSMGNLVYPTMAKWEVEEGVIDYKKLVERVEESIRMVEDSYIRRIHEKNGYIDYMKSILELCITRGNEVGIAGCISWCKLPFYEADFGWGKPIWIANPIKFPCGFNLLDSGDGKGIEVWLGLPEEEMLLLEKNKHFLSYVSLSQDV